MNRPEHTPPPSDQDRPNKDVGAWFVETLDRALEEFLQAVRLQRRTVSALGRLNDAAHETPTASDAIEAEVSKLIVKHLLEPGDSHPTDEIGEEEKG